MAQCATYLNVIVTLDGNKKWILPNILFIWCLASASLVGRYNYIVWQIKFVPRFWSNLRSGPYGSLMPPPFFFYNNYCFILIVPSANHTFSLKVKVISYLLSDQKLTTTKRDAKFLPAAIPPCGKLFFLIFWLYWCTIFLLCFLHRSLVLSTVISYFHWPICSFIHL